MKEQSTFLDDIRRGMDMMWQRGLTGDQLNQEWRRIINGKREAYLKTIPYSVLLAYKTASGRKVLEYESKLYVNDEQRDMTIVGGVPLLPFYGTPCRWVMDALCLPGGAQNIIPVVEAGLSLVAFGPQRVARYISTPVVKIVRERKHALGDLPVEEICARLYQKLDEPELGERTCLGL